MGDDSKMQIDYGASSQTVTGLYGTNRNSSYLSDWLDKTSLSSRQGKVEEFQVATEFLHNPNSRVHSISSAPIDSLNSSMLSPIP